MKLLKKVRKNPEKKDSLAQNFSEAEICPPQISNKVRNLTPQNFSKDSAESKSEPKTKIPVPRVLKARSKNLDSGDLGSDIETPRELGKYEKKRCSFSYRDESGNLVQCKSWACGGIDLCRVHAKEMGMSSLDIVKSRNGDVEFQKLPESYLVRTKFQIEKHPLLYIKMSKMGKSDVEIASEFGISLGTLKRWVSEISEMKEAYEIGQTMYEAFFLKKGVENLENDRFNNVLFKYLTMNKLGYSDKMETKSTMSGLHGVMVIPGTMSVEDWEKQTIIKEEKERMLDMADNVASGR